MRMRVISACVTAVITLGVAAPHSFAATGSGQASTGNARDDAKAQVEFGINVAQKKLWREATYRFERAVELDPTYAAAWNNLAIAYEEQGKFNEANRAYEKAIALDSGNILIRQNYDLFKELYDRISQRNRR